MSPGNSQNMPSGPPTLLRRAASSNWKSANRLPNRSGAANDVESMLSTMSSGERRRSRRPGEDDDLAATERGAADEHLMALPGRVVRRLRHAVALEDLANEVVRNQRVYAGRRFRGRSMVDDQQSAAGFKHPVRGREHQRAFHLLQRLPEDDRVECTAVPPLNAFPARTTARFVQHRRLRVEPDDLGKGGRLFEGEHARTAANVEQAPAAIPAQPGRERATELGRIGRSCVVVSSRRAVRPIARRAH